MKAVVLAYSNIGCEGIRALLRAGIEIISVFTHKDSPGENIWFESVAQLCAENNLPVFAPDNINEDKWVNHIRDLQPDIIFSFYYRNMVNKNILDIPIHGCLNLHGSLLPKFRGRCPVNWAVLMGEKVTGVTLHYMDEKPDRGAIVAQESVTIDDEDTAFDVAKKMSEKSGILLDKVLPQIENRTVTAIPQNDNEATYFGGRTPADGLIQWNQDAQDIHNLVRAVTSPFPGAFTYLKGKKVYIWKSQVVQKDIAAAPGSIISVSPLIVACGNGALEILAAQTEGGLYLSGEAFAQSEKYTIGTCFDGIFKSKNKKVLILGINGFIGNAIARRLLASGNWNVCGMDIADNNVQDLLESENFSFTLGNIRENHRWIEEQIKQCDVVMPLVAVATPIEYIRNPLRVFELDFEENLQAVRWCYKYHKRVLFPSTSEVYGMCDDDYFNEETSKLVLGPIGKSRWIYSCSKQMMDRVIFALGSKGLQFTIFRPFNWIGPKLDSLEGAKTATARAITQMILNLVEGEPIMLINGGAQRRCFTALEDGIDCLEKIIENKNNLCDGKIINIGNPYNEVSIKEFAELVIKAFNNHPLHVHFPSPKPFKIVNEAQYYGKGYQDCSHRRPDITNAKTFCEWEPHTSLDDMISNTMDYFLNQVVKK